MPLAEPSTDPSSPSIDAAAAALLRLLLIETYRDGGAAYATSYRDGGGGSAGRIPSLLREAGKKAGLRRSGPLRLLDFVDGLGPGAPLVTPAGGWGGDRGPPPHVVRIVGEEGGGDRPLMPPGPSSRRRSGGRGGLPMPRRLPRQPASCTTECDTA